VLSPVLTLVLTPVLLWC